MSVAFLIIWLLGFAFAFRAAQDNVFFEPTDAAVRAAARSVGFGVAGAVLMFLVPLAQAFLEGEVFWAIAAVPGAATALLLVREPSSHGQPFALLLLLVPVLSVAVLLHFAVRRRHA